MNMYAPNARRLLRPKSPAFFPDQKIIAVLDPIDNIIYFNSRYTGDRILERRALFMVEQVLRIPDKYIPPIDWTFQ
jgi:hypothetical protein